MNNEARKRSLWVAGNAVSDLHRFVPDMTLEEAKVLRAIALELIEMGHRIVRKLAA